MKKVIVCMLLFVHISFAHKQPVHQFIVREAFSLLTQQYGPIPGMAPYVGYTAIGGSNWDARQIVAGAWREDVDPDIVYYYDFNHELTDIYGPGVLALGSLNWLMTQIGTSEANPVVSASHFWNADAGDNSPVYLNIALPMLGDVLFGPFCNSYEKMTAYNGGRRYSMRWNGGATGGSFGYRKANGQLGNYNWFGSILIEYESLIELQRTGRAWIAGTYNSVGGRIYDNIEIRLSTSWRNVFVWEVLGRMCHLLGDMSVPVHDHNEEHGVNKDRYEEWVQNNYSYWTAGNVASLKGGVLNPNGTGDDPLHYLMYSVNQIADHYNSRVHLGDNNYTPVGEISSIISSLPPAAPYDTQDLTQLRDATLPYVIRATAGLMYWFATQTGMLVPPAPPIIITQNYVISPGNPSPFPPGSTVQVNPGIDIIVNGKLDVENVTFRSNVTGSNWNGITFNSANGSIINNCRIFNANSPIVINSTNTIEISGCTIGASNFGYDAAIRVYQSSPVITNTIIEGQPDSYNGIRFANGSSGIVDNSWIRNCGSGNGIVIEGGASPTIRENQIYGNHYHGIISIQGGSFTIVKNNIYNNGKVGTVRTYNGIYLLGSDGWIMENTISDNASGIYCDGMSSPTAFYPGGDVGTGGKNIISGNDYGIRANGNSSPIFGEVWESLNMHEGTCNQIINNTINSVYNVSSVIIAHRNWWGNPSGPTDTVNFDQGTTDVSFSLPSLNDALILVPKVEIKPEVMKLSKSSSFRDSLNQARKYFLMKLFNESEKLYEWVLTESAAQENMIEAANGMFHIYETTQDANMIANLEKLALGSKVGSTIISHLLMKMYMAAGKTPEMATMYSSIQKNYPASDLEKYAYIQMLANDRKIDNNKSLDYELSTPMFRRYSSSLDKGLLTALGIEPNRLNKLLMQTNSADDLMLVNYPNPFNPSTTISFTLAQDSFVSVQVFDILGRDVATLVNEMTLKGSHSVTFDAKNFSSGIYFCRIQAGSNIAMKKMQLVK